MLIARPLGELAKFLNGGTPRREVARYYEGTIPWITSADLEEGSDFVTEARFHITEEAIESSATRIVPKGGLLFVSRTGVGKIAIAGMDVCISQDFTGIIPNREIVDPRYLFRFLQAKQAYFVTLQRGATIKGVTRRVIEELEIPLPPLPEQRRIAAVLDAADALRAKRRAALAKLDALLQSVFLEMFGDPVRNEKGWEEQKVESLSDLVRGSSPRPKSDSRYYGGSVPRLMVADLTRDGLFVTPQIDSLTELGARQSRFTTRGTVVMAVSGNVGLTAILEVDACIHDGFVAFNNLANKKITAKYLLFCMHLLKQTHENRRDGAIFQNLTTDGIKKMAIPLPPLDVQQKWDLLLDKYQMFRSTYDTSDRKLTVFFNSLQYKAFRGEL